MRVFLTGASGAIGIRLVPQLIDRGHEVIGTSTSTGSAERVRALGAEAIELDLLDPRAVSEAVREARPDAIVHEATALANVRFARKPGQELRRDEPASHARAPTRFSPLPARRVCPGSSRRASR